MFISEVLNPNKIVVKKTTNGKIVTAKEFLRSYEAYVEVFNSGKIPTPEAIMDTYAKLAYHSAMEQALNDYKATINDQIAENGFLRDEALEREHNLAKTIAITVFNKAKKIG